MEQGGAPGYGYDEVGNRISQTDANNHTTSYTYDQLGRRLGRTLPLGQTESYSYDAAGNLQSKTDLNGHTTTYAYDSMNRLLSKTADPFFSSGACANGACGATQVGFTYNNLGQRATMTDATGKTTYGYDGAARLISVATPLANLSYNYDKQNNQTTTSWSGSGSGGFSTYTYDALNRLLTVNDTNTVAATASYAYDPVGNLSSVTYGNNVVHSYTYDALNRLTNLSLLCGTTTPNCGPGGSTQAASYAYTLGPAGNRTGVTELSGRTVTYGYDDLYRLTSETIANATSQNGTIGYTYDAVGNRQQITSTVNAIPTSGMLLYDANDRTATDTYDNDGNTVAQAGITNVYDFENHLVQHGAMTITYDGDGNRVAETVGGVTTKYLVDSNTLTGYAQVRAEFQSGTRVLAYMYGLERLAEVQTVNNVANTINYYGFDGHGSVRNLTNTSSVVTDTYDYDAFGNLLNSTGTTPNSYLFAGESYDSALGLYYNRARYMTTTAGRFLSQDPSEGRDEEPLTLHRYMYAGDDPVDNTDPSGEDFSIGEVSAGLDMMNTINAMPQLNFNTVLQNVPKQETLYVRSFAPWKKFGAYPPVCYWNCYGGDDRSFTTSRNVTSRINGIIKFLLPSMTVLSQRVYSDLSHDFLGRTATGHPTMTVAGTGGGSMHVEMAGANPLAPGAPDIDTKLDISVKVNAGQACYSGHMYGDAFPNAETFVVNSKDQATMLHTFQTTGGPVTGPIHFLPGNGNRDMGSFSSQCAPE